MSENNLSKDEMDFVLSLIDRIPETPMDSDKKSTSWPEEFLGVYLSKAGIMLWPFAKGNIKEKDKDIIL